jgi:hypothetical protein
MQHLHAYNYKCYVQINEDINDLLLYIGNVFGNFNVI